MKHNIRCAVGVTGLLVGIFALTGCHNGGLGLGSSGGSDQYGIMIYSFSGHGHQVQAETQLAIAEQVTGWKGFQVISTGDSSRVLWGKYRSIESAQRDLKRAKTFVLNTGQRPFGAAVVIPLPTPDIGPPEWKLDGAPGDFTVLVAVFYNIPEANYVGRKKFAVMYCEQLRQEGELAFYKHGAVRSFVTVGLFGKSAVRNYMDGPVQRTEIIDLKAVAIMEKYPLLAVNGREERIRSFNPKTGKFVSIPQKTRLIGVPGKKESNETPKDNRSSYPQSW